MARLRRERFTHCSDCAFYRENAGSRFCIKRRGVVLALDDVQDGCGVGLELNPASGEVIALVSVHNTDKETN